MNIALLAGLALTLLGIYLLKHSLSSYQKALASQRWPSVNGQLTDVLLWGSRNIGGEIKDVEKLNVEYNYQINGQNYTGTLPTFYTLMYPETLEFANQHPVNSDIKIYYNPKNPSESVLIPGPRKDKPYSDLILGFLGVIIGAAIAVLSWMGIIG
ncbi:MAG: DUF3592 domain-containing protein [Methylophaga sp.]|uniref:DUF3592 domain-containing protein n=1 Tax=Methylophaga sp. TaxID=2024840 RepID=UPI000C0D95C4|nr:DUF3592 domain-containing protein [Methylophaga sp.]MBL1458310.1 DUF3592 domain-containing protein [Methylophaga sp.]